jgi:hypothetical protein
MKSTIEIIPSIFVFIILQLLFYVIISRIDRRRIPKIKKALSSVAEGTIQDGKNLILWSPGTAFRSMFFALLAFIVLIIFYYLVPLNYDSFTYFFPIFSCLVPFLIAIVDWFLLYSKSILWRVITADLKGFEVLFFKNGIVHKRVKIDWDDVDTISLNIGTGGGTSGSGANNGVILQKLKEHVMIPNDMINEPLLLSFLTQRIPQSHFQHNAWLYAESRIGGGAQRYLSEEISDPK